MRITQKGLEQLLKLAIDPASRNIYYDLKYILSHIDPKHHIVIKDLIVVLNKLSKKWDKEIDKLL